MNLNDCTKFLQKLNCIFLFCYICGIPSDLMILPYLFLLLDLSSSMIYFLRSVLDVFFFFFFFESILFLFVYTGNNRNF